MTIYPNLVLDALRTVRYPGTGKDIVEMGMVNDDIRIDGNRHRPLHEECGEGCRGRYHRPRGQ